MIYAFWMHLKKKKKEKKEELEKKQPSNFAWVMTLDNVFFLILTALLRYNLCAIKTHPL